MSGEAIAEAKFPLNVERNSEKTPYMLFLTFGAGLFAGYLVCLIAPHLFRRR